MQQMEYTLPWWQMTYQVLAGILLVAVLGLVLTVAWMYWKDVHEIRHTLRRNYPVLGRFRYLFEHLGVFFRQYFFAMDREELPFNRAMRSWVYRAAKNEDSTVPFGSTMPLNVPGTLLFSSALFPPLDDQILPVSTRVIGPYCRQPFTPRSLFNISAMSYGAISVPAVRALSQGAAKAGCWMNSGEGGLSPHHLSGGCDIVFQIGTAKYGVRNDDGSLSHAKLQELAAIERVRMFEIKLSQGAKPGKGGILPGAKVTPEIAQIRGIPVGQDSLSPNRHTDIGSIDELLDRICEIRELTGKPVGFKTVMGSTEWVDQLCKRIRERGVERYAPDFITLDSGDGGTGAAPQSLIDYVGMPLRESLPLLVDKLNQHGLRQRICVIASGKLIIPAHVAAALCAGADFVNTARGFMFALGCIQALQCNKNTCPTGVTTHNPHLQQGLIPAEKSERVANYVRNMVHEVEVIAHSCGVAEPRLLRRHHLRVISESRQSVPLDAIYPDVSPMTSGDDGC